MVVTVQLDYVNLKRSKNSLLLKYSEEIDYKTNNQDPSLHNVTSVS